VGRGGAEWEHGALLVCQDRVLVLGLQWMAMPPSPQGQAVQGEKRRALA
jgi:hypothetical protein